MAAVDDTDKTMAAGDWRRVLAAHPASYEQLRDEQRRNDGQERERKPGSLGPFELIKRRSA